jgi:hypothetical protein
VPSGYPEPEPVLEPARVSVPLGDLKPMRAMIAESLPGVTGKSFREEFAFGDPCADPRTFRDPPPEPEPPEPEPELAAARAFAYREQLARQARNDARWRAIKRRSQLAARLRPDDPLRKAIQG